MASLPDGLVMRPIITAGGARRSPASVERTFGGSRLTDAEISNRRGSPGASPHAGRVRPG